MGKQRLGALAVVLGCMDAATKRRPVHQRAMQPATGAVTHKGGVADNLLEARIDKSKELEFCHWPQALCGHADGNACDQILRQGRVHYPLVAEALLEPNGGAEYAAIGGDV